jgi:hypothetical protein
VGLEQQPERDSQVEVLVHTDVIVRYGRLRMRIDEEVIAQACTTQQVQDSTAQYKTFMLTSLSYIMAVSTCVLLRKSLGS